MYQSACRMGHLREKRAPPRAVDLVRTLSSSAVTGERLSGLDARRTPGVPSSRLSRTAQQSRWVEAATRQHGAHEPGPARSRADVARPRAVVSPFVSPSPRFWLCRARALRNHNPRVGGSSPSSGIRSACKSVLPARLWSSGLIPRVPRSGTRTLAAARGVVQASLTIVSPGASPASPRPAWRPLSCPARRGRAGLPGKA